MTHKNQMSSQQKDCLLDFLRKQRDGTIIGDYRSILAQIYNGISAIHSEQGRPCRLEDLQGCFEGTSIHEKNVILDYCFDLEQLGYIGVEDGGNIVIKREIDF